MSGTDTKNLSDPQISRMTQKAIRSRLAGRSNFGIRLPQLQFGNHRKGAKGSEACCARAQMKAFYNIANGRDGCTIVDVLEVKKEIPD